MPQPWSSRQLGLSDSESYLANCAAISERMASAAVAEVVRELEGRHYRIVGSAVLLAAGRPLPSLVKILASHPLIHTAEGEFFCNAVRKACEILKIAVTTIRERELDAQAKTTFGKAASQVQHRISTLGISIGPPWTKDHKTAALAAANDFGMPLVNFSTSSQNRLLKQSIIRPMIKHNIHVVRSVSF